ncbi:hypothetical protein EV127DRAFT_221412 [Xylaria flabelliformis]|nr:hypothetical protein EV127DRAFT_221412 [Xylaria flabelliformis]
MSAASVPSPSPSQSQGPRRARQAKPQFHALASCPCPINPLSTVSSNPANPSPSPSPTPSTHPPSHPPPSPPLPPLTTTTTKLLGHLYPSASAPSSFHHPLLSSSSVIPSYHIPSPLPLFSDNHHCSSSRPFLFLVTVCQSGLSTETIRLSRFPRFVRPFFLYRYENENKRESRSRTL